MEEKKHNPLFIERGDGLGWTFNWENKWSYLALAILIILVACGIWAAFTAK